MTNCTPRAVVNSVLREPVPVILPVTTQILNRSLLTSVFLSASLERVIRVRSHIAEKVPAEIIRSLMKIGHYHYYAHTPMQNVMKMCQLATLNQLMNTQQTSSVLWSTRMEIKKIIIHRRFKIFSCHRRLGDG